jgi:hypothetical protein
VSRARARAAALLAAMYWPLVAVVAGAVVIRIVAMTTYSSAVFAWQDSLRFIRVAPFAPLEGVFDDPWLPAGYPLALSAVRGVTNELWVTIALQHLAGVTAGVLLYLSVRRFDAPRWLALIPAGVLLLSGDFVYWEHNLMTEAPFTVVIAAGLYMVSRGLTGGGHPALVAGGVLLALSALVRNTGLALVPLAAVVAAYAGSTPLRERLIRGAAVLLPALLVVGAYAVVATSAGRYSGIADLNGWFLYGRAAPFADCQEFQPPRNLRVLCEQLPPEQRKGAYYYVNDADGPGRQWFDLAPWACSPRPMPERPCKDSQDDEVREFALDAITHQPGAYARVVVRDLARYVDPAVSAPRPRSGSLPEQARFGAEGRPTAEEIAGYTDRRYDGVSVDNNPGDAVLGSYQRVVHLGGLALLAALVLALLGAIAARGPLRWAILLFGLTAALLYVIPVVTWTYDARYGIPGQPFLIAAGACGALALATRATRRERSS